MNSSKTKTLVPILAALFALVLIAPVAQAETPLEEAQGHLDDALAKLDVAVVSYQDGSPKKAKKQVTNAISDMSEALELFRDEAINDQQRKAVEELRQSRHKLAQVVLNLDGKNFETAEKQFQEAIEAYRKAREIAIGSIDS